MATINDVYSLACNAGYIDANEFSEQAFGDMLKDKDNRRTYYEHVKKLDPNFYSRDYDTFSANVDRMLGMSGSQQSSGRVAGSNPSVKDNPAPTNAQEYQANLQNQWSGAENNFNIPEPNDKPYSEWSDVELRAAHQRMVDEGERVRQQREQQIKDEADERKQWSKEHPVRAFFRDGFNSPDQNRYIAETALESDDARTFVSDKERLQGIEDELGRRAKDTVIPQAKESTRQSEEMTAKVRENSKDFSLHQKANLGAAEYLNTKANEILNAGSKFDDSKAMANWWEGLKNDLDRDVSGIMGAQRAGRISGIVTKLNNGEELTDDEAALLNAYINLAAATEARQFDLSTAYQIGQGTAQSVPFMVDMILTHGGGALAKRGVIKALAKTGSKHIATAAKWLQVPENVVAAELKAAGRNVGQLAETTAKRTFKEAAKDFGRKAVYETIATPAQTVLMPSSWEMMLDEAAKTKLQPGKSELSFLDKARIFTNAAQETLTERAGGELIDWGLGRAFGAATKPWHLGGKGQNAITKYIQSPIGETAEEYIGALLSLVRSYNPLYDDESNQKLRDDADEMFTAEGFGKTFGTILPMSLLGGAYNTGSIFVKTKQLDTARKKVLDMLTNVCGMEQEEAEQILSYTEGASNAKEFTDRANIVANHISNGIDENLDPERQNLDTYRDQLKRTMNEYADRAANLNKEIGEFSERYNKLSDEEKEQARKSLSDVQKQVAQQNMQNSAKQMAEAEIDGLSNKDNNYLYNVGFADGSMQEGDDAYVVGGNVAVKQTEDGRLLFDKEVSEDKVVAVRVVHADGTSEVKQVSIDELDLLQEPVSVPEYIEQRAGGIYQEMLAALETQKQQAPTATYRGTDGKEIAVVSVQDGVATLSEPINVEGNQTTRVPIGYLDGLMQELGYEKAETNTNTIQDSDIQEQSNNPIPFAENLAAAPRDKMGRVDYRAIKTSDELAKVVTAEMKGNKDDAKDFITMKKKAAEKAKKSLKHKSNEDSAAFLEVRKKEKELQALVSMWDNALTSLRTIRTAEEQAAYDAEQARLQAQREARKQTEAGAVGKTMAERYAAAPKIDGNAGTITTANGQVLKGHYVLVSADGLTPSHDARNGFEMTAGYPTVDGHSINDRDYKNDPEEQAKVQQVAQQYNGNAIKNMPIVSDGGMVYNGNGRIMAGQLAAQQGTDGAYRQALEDNSAQFGFTPEQVATIPNARVVFQTDERLPYNTTTLAMFNATEQQAQSNTSKAAANTRKLTPEAVGHIINAISGFENTDAFFTDKKAPFNLIDLLIKDGILSDRDKASLIDGNRLSGAGKDVLTSLLFGTAFDEQTIRLLADSPQVQNSVMRALPQIIENKGLGELSLFDHINNAIAAIYDMREKGMSFYEYTHQTDIYGATAKDNFSAFELLLADEMMSSGVSAFRDVLTLYNERARQENGGQSSMLGETVTRENIENEIVEYYKKLKDEQRKQKQSERGQGSASTQSAVASTQGGNRETVTDLAANEIVKQIEDEAEEFEEIELTPENWLSQFGEDGLVDTPIGKVKMGEHQYLKLAQKGRDGKLGMIKPTLERPSIIIEDNSKAKEGQETEREHSYVFVKAFVKRDGKRIYYFTSITVKKDGQEVVVSNQEKRRSIVINLLNKGNLAWKRADNVSTVSDVTDGLYSSQGNASDPTTEGTDAPHATTSNEINDSNNTLQTAASKPHGGRIGTTSSASKGTENSSTDQTKSQKNAENLQNASGNEQKVPKSQFADNKIFKEDAVEAARRRMRERMNRLNAGLDPEMMSDGLIIAGAYVESGVRKFADFAKRMISDFGDKIRPYLKAFYNGLRDMPEVAEYAHELDDYNTVSAIDVNTITVDEETKKDDSSQKNAENVRKSGKKAVPLHSTEKEYSAGGRSVIVNTEDYHTYITPEVKEVFAELSKTEKKPLAIPECAYIHYASIDSVKIPADVLLQDKHIKAAQAKIDARSGESLQLSDEQIKEYSKRLLDKEHGSAVLGENGKIRKRNGEEDFSGEVARERKALFVIGRPAGGKSSVYANPLSAQYKARIIDSDVVKPWLDGYEGGDGAGYVQEASDAVARVALENAITNGDNIVIPKIGGESIIKMAAELRQAGYDVELYYNEVSEASSIMRAMARFAETGRYLSIGYLLSIKDKPEKTFKKFANKTTKEVQDERPELFVSAGQTDAGGVGPHRYTRGGGKGQENSPRDLSGATSSRYFFSRAEWKSNDVRIGEPTRLVWSSESDEPIPGTNTIRKRPIAGIENMTRGEVAAEIAKRNKKSKASKAKTKQEEGTLNMFGNERQSNTELTEENLHGGQKVLLKDGSVATVMMVSRAGAVTPYGAEKPHISSIYLTDGREIQFSDISAINPTETTDTDSYSTKRSAESVEISKNDRDNISARQSDGKPQKRNTRNNHVERGVDYAPKSTAERIKANIAAIKLLKQLQDEGRQASEQDKEVLRKFTGWGGLGEAFKGEPGTTYYSYGGEKSPYQQLQDILTPEELESAQLSRNSAYYTPANVIDALWDVAVKCGFRGGNVLEGSAGIGEILARIPSNANAQSNITAVEIDPITGGILQQLYPDADVHIDGFQNVNIPNNSQDLVITNVPFVRDLHVTDKVEKDITKKFGNSIQDFCIAKNILKLRKGGIGIFIAGKSSMDSSKKLRAWIVGEAWCDVVGAFRLNKDTFGGTGATADIIVVRKRVNGIQPSTLSETFVSAPAVSETEVEVDKRWNRKTMEYKIVKKKAVLSYNALYQQHPEWMGGEMRIGADEGDTRFGGTSSACYPKSNIDQQKRLADWAKSLHVGIESIPHSPLERVEEQAFTNDWEQLPREKYESTKIFSLMPNSKGEICRLRGGGYLEPISNNNKVKGDTKEQVLKVYNRIKQAISDVLAAQTNSTDNKQLKKAQAELNVAYDVFVSKYGQLNKNVAIAFLRNDIDFSSVAAIEQYEEIATPEGKQIKTSKTDIFSKRVVGVKPEIKPTNITDAIVLSMQQFGGIHTEDIAKWLGKRTDDVVREIVDSRLGFEDPQTGQLQVRHVYLSGNVREKLRYAQENNEGRRYNTNIEELQKVIPQDIPAHLIGFSIGSTWFGEDLFNDFLREKYALDHKVRHIGGVWVSDINDKWGKNTEKNRAAGVYSKMLDIQIYGSDLFLAAMNNTPIAVQRAQKNYDGRTETVTDKVASRACATRIDEIKDEFTQWARDKMQQNPDLAERMERLYNERFNAIVPMEIDSRFTTPYLSGMNPNVSPLYDIQQKAVVRATMQPTLFAHEVGTGKTRSLICSAMEMRRLGTAKKPMIVVQNATVMQFVEEAKNLYPNAKVLTVDYKDRTADGRKFFYSKIKYNDWDIIIVPQSVFNMIPDSDERKRDFIQAKIEEKEHAYQAAKEAGLDKNTLNKYEKELANLQDDYADLNMSGKNRSKKDKGEDEKKAAVRRENAKQAAEKMVDRRTDDVENFDDMGIDALLVDEAHNYKHLGFSTMMQRGVKGVDPSYSQRAASLYLKCQAVFEKTGHKNVVFATGTPISNTAAEVWIFMKYLIPEDVMRENEIYYFDDFVRNFGKITQSLEFATNGKFKEYTRFASYMNIPELARLWGIITDTRLSDEVKTASGNSLKDEKIPTLENGKQTDIFLEQSPSLVLIMNAVRAQLDKFENMSGADKRANSSIPLTMYGIAKRAAIDPRLVDENATDETDSKTNKSVEETLKALEDSKAYKGTVAIFCDSYRRQDFDNQTGKKTVGFNIYDEIKRKLTKAGVPAGQIAIIKSDMTDTAKQKVFDAVNEGDIRVILGSTETLGTGVNIQTRLFTLIHMDAPDRPMDMTQREGRILRQGNMHKTMNIPVRIIRLGVKDSLDVTAYQRLKTKSQFIDSIMRSKYSLLNNQDGRTIEEDEEGLYDNPVAVLSGSQYAMLKSQAEREYRKLDAKKKQYEQDQIYINSQTKRNKLDIQAAEKRISNNEKRLQILNDTFKGVFPTDIVVDGVSANGEDNLKNALRAASKKVLDAQKDFLDERTYNNEETRVIDVPMSFNGLLFTVHVEMRKTSEFRDGKRNTTIRRYLSYSSIPLSIKNELVSNNTVDLAKVFDEILTKEISGFYAKERIQNAKNLIDRKQKDNEEMSKRFGKPFEFEEQLAAAKSKVDEYTEKMREEMAEKEEKYKHIASNSHFDIDKAIDREVNSDDDSSEAQYTEMDYDEENLLAEQQVALDAVITALDKAGIEVEQVSEEEARAEFEKGTATYKSSGTIYGYAKGGKIYLTPKGMNPNTPIHEYAHLWAKAMQHNNPQGWKSVVWRMKGTPMWEEVVNDPRYQSLSNEDAIASEVMARYSGKRGAERMERLAKQMLDHAETRSDVAKTVSLIQRVKKALQDFWKWVGENLFDIKRFSSAEEVADRVLYDLMNGTNIKQQSDNSARLMLQIMEQGTKEQSSYPIAGAKTKKKSSLDTEIVELLRSPLKVSVVSREDGAKIQKKLETTKQKYKINQDISNAVSDIGKALGATQTGGSQYVTIETKNGNVITIRISNHNATVSNFDKNGEKEGISLVISRKPNNGITNDGDAHITEFFYSDKKLRHADGTPIAEIIQSIEQTLYSGEYKDPTGLAKVQEVNIPADTQAEYSRIRPDETLGEYAHRIAEAKRKERDNERSEFSMGDAPTPDPDETRGDYVARFNMWYNAQRSADAEYDYVQAMKKARRKTERALQHVANRYRPLQKFQEYILSKGGTIRRSEQDADGNLVRQSADAYKDTTLATGRAGYQIQRFASHQLKDMVDAVAAIINSHKLDDIDIRWNNVDTYFTDKKNAKNGKQLTARELVGIYAQAKDCQEAIEQELPDRGKDGFLRNLQDVNGNPVSHTEVIRLVEGALEQEQINNLWQSINAATQFSLDYQLRNGMIDQATYDQFHRNYYVPERGWRERDLDGREDGYTEGRGTQLNGNPYNAALKKARGRDSIASDPFAYIQSIAETTILSTERNNVKQKFLQMLLDNEEIGMKSGAWKIRRAYVVRVTDSNGEKHEVVTYKRPKDESTIVTSVVPESMIAQRTRDERLQHSVAVMRNGQQYIIELQDETLANALNNNFKEAQWLSNSFANVMRTGVRYMSAINTQYNPAFAIWNLARDLQIGIINNAAKESGAFQARFLKNIAAVQPTIMQYVWKDHMKGEENFGKSEELSRYLHEYFESGAQTGFSYMQDIQTLGKEFDKLVKGDGKAKRALEATTDFMSMATELSELIVRFAEFATARQMGFTTEEAAAKAKEISVNFDRKGLLGGTFSGLYSFFNATIQGTWNILRGLKTKRAWIAYLSIAVVYAALGFINTLLNPDDPDDDIFFSDYERQTNFLIGKIKLPVTHFFRMFFAAGVNITLMGQGKKTGTQTAYDIVNFVLDEIVPASALQLHNLADYNETTNQIEFAPEKYAQAIAPSYISPFTDVMLNRDFKGATVHREPFITADKDKFKRVSMEKRNTPEIYHDIAYGLHRISGGNPDVKTKGGSDGLIDINANDLQHIFEGYAGGTGKFVGDLVSLAIGAAQGEFDVSNVPVVNRAFRPYQQERAYTQQYWLLKNRVDHYNALLKDTRENDPEEYRQMINSDLYDVYRSSRNAVSNSRKPQDDKTYTADQVKDLMKLNVQWNKAQ